jgi:hypothetical protein
VAQHRAAANRLDCKRSASIELPPNATVFRLNARRRPKTGSEPAFRRNEAEHLYTTEAAHNPEVAGSSPAPATAKGAGNGAFRFPPVEPLTAGSVVPMSMGGCSCGAIRYGLSSEPLFTHCCHCLNCQRQTGSAFVINLLIEADRMELLAGDPHPVEVPRDDGSVQRIFRCPDCQVAIFSEYGGPAVRFVRGGTLDEPSEAAPDVHIYTRSKVPWITLPDSVPAFEAFYDLKGIWPETSLERLDAAMRGGAAG